MAAVLRASSTAAPGSARPPASASTEGLPAPRAAPERRIGVFRIQVFSDLHADVADGILPTLAEDVDAVVVAGDTCRGPVTGFGFLRQIVPARTPLIVVAGNHEHYRGTFPSTVAAARKAAPEHGIAFLEDGAFEASGVRFLGCTLWTDYALHGADRIARAMASASAGMNDHRRIDSLPGRRFTPGDAAAVHRASRAFLSEALATPFAGPTVVVTHHAPHAGSIHSRYEGDPLNTAFASDLTDVIRTGRPALWIHGHVHSSFDYEVAGTRIVCNPRGYGSENPGFDPSLVVEVAR